jgi:hypothetical protein
MTRRKAGLLAVGVAGGLGGVVVGRRLGKAAGAAISFTDEMIEGDTAIRIQDGGNGANFEGFLVLVRTKVKCTDIVVTVFYRTTMEIEAKPTSLLLYQESIAPRAGWDAYGATRRDFTMPKASVERIQLTFLTEVGERAEFGR